MLITTILAASLLTSRAAPAQGRAEPAPGQLTIVGRDGKVGDLCPLERTSVGADVSGFGARVTVTQNFKNPTNAPIEAVYTFPLPNDAAVDSMQMVIGNRVVEGEIKRTEEARRVYEAAKNAGQSAALLDQQRPNIFTQSVANIMPGAKIQIKISYVQILKYEDGQFEFNFPMVVGPRFLGNAPDPGKIAPPIVPKGTRSGANIDLTVNLNAGAPIQGFNSVLHKVNVNRIDESHARITLAKADEIPNRDFILRYQMATGTVQDAFITHMGEKGGFFSLILMPPKAPTVQQVAAKEMIFVMDQSGSQQGFPIQKSKELTLKLIKTLRPNDTFNVIGFNNTVRALWPTARPNTPDNIAAAEAFVGGMDANGGTQLREGVVAALQGQSDRERLRIVVFNTDGFVGDEAIILDTIKKQRNQARMFTFGIGNGVNRYLIDEMSSEGKGDAEYVTLAEAADGAVDRFIKRTRTPVLTDVAVQFQGVTVQDALPEAIPDVFSDRPVVVTGRYLAAGHGKLTLTGKLGGKPWSKTIDLDFPSQANAPALESLWARRKVDELTRQNYLVSVVPTMSKASVEDIVHVALEFRIMTQFTSFVAVEKKIVNIGGKQRTVAVPVEMTDGVSYEGILGRENRRAPGAPMGLFRGGGGGGPTGSGGFSGASVTASAAKMNYFGQDKSDNSIILRDEEETLKQMAPDQKRKYLFETRVEKALREAKGKVEIQIWLSKLTPEILQKLKGLGLKVEQEDRSLKVVFGTCDAKDLIELAQIAGVDRIKKL